MTASTGAAAQASVFISYTHESEEHRERVLALSDRLRAEGVTCEIDRFYESNPPVNGWAAWMEQQVEEAEFVLMVCTPTYLQRFKQGVSPDSGRGVQWEGAAITLKLYEAAGRNTKFIPIGFASLAANRVNIPLMLQGTNYYDVSTEDGYDRLYRHVTHQPEVVAGPVGQRRVMSVRQPATGTGKGSVGDGASATMSVPAIPAPDATRISPLSSLSPAQIRKLLTERATLVQIGEVWFDLFGTTMTDSLPGKSKPECVIELITRAAQRSKTQALLDAIAEVPDILSSPFP